MAGNPLIKQNSHLSPETSTYCNFGSVKERPLVALFLHGNQLLDHLLLLWVQCGCFLWRGGGDLCGRAGCFLLLLLLHLLQSDLFLGEHTYRSREGRTAYSIRVPELESIFQFILGIFTGCYPTS